MESQTLGGAIIANSGEMTDMFNIVCGGSTLEKESIGTIIQYFKNRHLPFAWWVGFENEPTDLEEILKQQGLNNNEAELAMVSELKQSNWPQVASFLVIKKVDSTKLLGDMISVICNLVPNEAQPISKVYSMAEKLILDEKAPIKFYIGYLDGDPVSTCSIFFTDNIAGIYDIIASPQVRGKGIGSAMTLKAMQVAQEQGCTHCVLTATNDAKFLYEKLGFTALKEMWVYN